MASTYNNIGNTYERLNEFGKALQNYQRSAALYDELGNAKGRASALVSIGTTHSDLGERDKAAIELQEAIALYRGLGNRLDRGKAHNNLGQVLSRLGRPRKAHAHFDTARTVFTELDTKDPLTRNLFYAGEAYLAVGRAADALKVCRCGLVLADSLGLLTQRKECTECVMRALALAGDFRSAYDAQRSYLSLDDTLDKVDNGKEVLRLELVRDFEQQQIADSLARVKEAYAQQLAFDRRMADERSRRGLLIAGILLVLVITGALLNRLRYHPARQEGHRAREGAQ